MLFPGDHEAVLVAIKIAARVFELFILFHRWIEGMNEAGIKQQQLLFGIER